MKRYFLTEVQAEKIIKSIPEHEWDVKLDGSYGVMIFENETRQVIVKNDAFGGRVAFTVQDIKREIPSDARILKESLDDAEITFLKKDFPNFYSAICSL